MNVLVTAENGTTAAPAEKLTIIRYVPAGAFGLVKLNAITEVFLEKLPDLQLQLIHPSYESYF
ncbi:hypothetical protein JCM21738_5049 [Mesobacillus boroniphilus JCM 21738]|uniref:Uncharacterized protein n=2 Tax=Mesobacillus boroniphilus TaxID=308892 RepID=W4RV76_9BACI|nr:hypothetical protein JCM21738_5049 [Mesobacillus boroniphilus JCM 21738]